ncbi:MAG: protocatechuate 3,4-dioxygenase [Nitrospiraceae bacterium]
MANDLTRRRFVFTSLGSVGLWLLAPTLARADELACLLTPPQTEGPYYPPQRQLDALLDKDSDLTVVKGKSGRATGQLLYVTGHLQDSHCRPIEGALAEIWQASANGRYHHPRDAGNPAPLDPFFQYWGKAVTDREGRYLFKTIKPGEYEADRGWIRPSHIHFKVRAPNGRDLTTQMYFAGDPHQEDDYILRRVPPAERSRVIVPFESPTGDVESTAKVCRFNLTL